MSDRGFAVVVGPGLVGSLIAVLIWGGALMGPGLMGSLGASPPTASPATPTTSPPPSATPTTDRASLEAVLTVDQSLVASREALRAAVDASTVSSPTIASILRGMNVQLGVGIGIAERLLAGPSTAVLAVDLQILYRRALEASQETLRFTLTAPDAYEAGARQVIAALDGIEALDARVVGILDTGVDPVASSTASPSTSPSPSPSPSPSAPASSGATASPSPSPASPTPAASTGPTPTPTENLLDDPGFETLSDPPWALVVSAEAAATVERDTVDPAEGAAAARIDITRTSDARNGISLEQSGIALIAGQRYQVAIQVRAEAPREVRLRLTGGDGQTYATRLLQVGTEWSRFEFDFAILVGDPDAHLVVDLGRSTITTWVDDAFLGPVTGS